MTEDDNRWHLDRKVPIGIILALLLQAVIFVAFLTRMDSRIGELEKARIVMVATQAERDARQDGDSKEALQILRNYLDRMDAKMDRLLERARP